MAVCAWDDARRIVMRYLARSSDVRRLWSAQELLAGGSDETSISTMLLTLVGSGACAYGGEERGSCAQKRI